MSWEKGLAKVLFDSNRAEVKELLVEVLKEHPELIPKAELRPKRMLRNKDIIKKYNVHSGTATSRINEFNEEYLRIDSKVPRSSLQWLNPKTRVVDEDVFDWFLANRLELGDSNARKRISAYKSN